MYNELISLPSLLRHIQTYSSQGHEIIIIDDGSTDGSDKYLTKQDFIKLLRFDKNLGKGLAIKSGIENSSNQTGISNDRMEYYFHNEVRNSLDTESTEGLLLFLKEVCKMEDSPIWAKLS